MSDPVRPDVLAATALRVRLLAAVGLSAVVLPGCWLVASKCGDPVQTTLSLDALADTAGDTSDGELTGETPTNEDCPTDLDGVAALLEANGEYCSLEEFTLLEQDGRSCTYEISCFTCCGYGRPYLDERGAPVTADTVAGPAWVGGARTVEAALTAQERRRVGAFWRKNAQAEHSSVAGFHRFALDLLAHGAPPELLARAQRAAAQELRHAIDCFTLASDYLGEPIGPAPMNLGLQVPVARSLAELAAWTARDGAIGETLAAFLAERALSETTDPQVRRVLSAIVEEETEHAALAWATLRWAIEAGGEEVRQAVREVFASIQPFQRSEGGWSPSLAAHGVPSPDQELADAETGVTRVVLPMARAMLSALVHPTGGESAAAPS